MLFGVSVVYEIVYLINNYDTRPRFYSSCLLDMYSFSGRVFAGVIFMKVIGFFMPHKWKPNEKRTLGIFFFAGAALGACASEIVRRNHLKHYL